MPGRIAPHLVLGCEAVVMHRRSYLAGVAVAAAGLAGCAGLLAEDYDVGMSPTAFEPVEVTVVPGEEVVWRNTSSRGHTVTAYGDRIPDDAAYFATGGFDSEAAAREAWNGGGRDGIIGPGETFSHVFEVPGRYAYVCLPHESAGMTGIVAVEE